MEKTWEQMLDYIQSSGATPAQIMDGVVLAKRQAAGEKLVSFNEKEYFILRRLVEEANKNINDSRSGTGAGLKLSMPESFDLNSLYRKLWHSRIETEDHHAEGTFA